MLETWGRVKGWFNATWRTFLRWAAQNGCDKKIGRVQLRLLAHYREHEYLSFKGSRAKLSMIISDLTWVILTETRRRLIHTATFSTMPGASEKSAQERRSDTFAVWSQTNNKDVCLYSREEKTRTGSDITTGTRMNFTRAKSILVTFIAPFFL